MLKSGKKLPLNLPEGEIDFHPTTTTMTRSQKSMGKKFAYFYFMKKEPEKIRQIAPQHVEYWQELNLEGYLGGPFSDRSGGLITFSADNIDQATDIVKKARLLEKTCWLTVG